MSRMISCSIVMTPSLLIGGVFCAISAQVLAQSPEAKGKAIVLKMCVGCHNINVVTAKRGTPAQWSATVQQMVSRGANGTDDEIDMVIRYLSEDFGPQSPRSELLNPVDNTSVTHPGDNMPAAKNASANPTSQANGADTTQAATNEPLMHINVNSANMKEFENSLSLSAKEAQTVIKYREQNGKFKDWQEVAEIPGVPAGKIQDLRRRIIF